MARRVRLTFSSDIPGLALPRSSLILLPELNTIRDVAGFIRDRYFNGVSDIRIRIEISGFIIDYDERTEIIRDEDVLTVVIVAGKHPEPVPDSDQLDERALKRIERHCARREKQRKNRKLSEKTKPKKSKVDLRASSGGVVIMADSSNSDAPVISKSPEKREPADVHKNVSKPKRSEKSATLSRPQQPPSFSRISMTTGAVKPLPKGHFRFDSDTLEVVQAETEAPLCHVRNSKHVEQAKRLGSFYFKSALPNADTTNDNAESDRHSEAVEVPQLQQACDDPGRVANCDTEMSHTGPDISESPSSEPADLELVNHVDGCTKEDDEEEAVLLQTIATRGQNFFAPRTLNRFGLNQNEPESDHDSVLQSHCESLVTISDPLSLRSGSEIAFRRLEIVNWAPQLSKFKKYRVLELDVVRKELTLVTTDDQEETIRFDEMHDAKLLDGGHDPISVTRLESCVDQEIADALQAKRLSMLANAQS